MHDQQLGEVGVLLEFRLQPVELAGLEGASFAIGTLRSSGLSITFAPQPASRRELHSFSFAGMAEMLAKYEASTPVAAE